MTKREMFVAIKAVVADNQEMVDFLDHQIEVLDSRKNSKSSKPTAKQLENAELKERIKEMLADERHTCGELSKALTAERGEDISSQRVSALLTQMGDKGTNEVVKTMEKKVAWFSLA